MALFLFFLGVLGGTYGATHSPAAQTLVLFILIFVVHPAATRRFGVRWGPEWTEAPRRRPLPLNPLAWSLTFALGWGAVVVLFAPDLGLGGWFWWLVIMWPWTEVLVLLLERRATRDDGAARWSLGRAIVDTGLAALVAVPLVTVPMLVADYSATAALATGVGGGVGLFLLTAVLTWRPARGARSST